MKTIIAGSRNINIAAVVPLAVQLSRLDVTELVCGMARGIDKIAFKWASRHNIPTKQMAVSPQEWTDHGKAAGPMRNARMAEYADALIAIWDGSSAGTKNMLQEANKRRLNVRVYHIDWLLDRLVEVVEGVPPKPYIVGAAIKVHGSPESVHSADVIMAVERPGRHHHIRSNMARDGLPTPIGGRPRHTQGFITNDGSFLDRCEAEDTARFAGQLTQPNIGGPLTSEDLW